MNTRNVRVSRISKSEPASESDSTSGGKTTTDSASTRKSKEKSKRKSSEESTSSDPTQVHNISKRMLELIQCKYNMTLKLINLIFTSHGIECVKELTDVKNVDRNVFIDRKNYTHLDQMIDDIYKYFGKKECSYNQRNKIKNYILTIIKNMCRQLALELTKKYKNIQIKGFVKSYIFYSIEYTRL
jgi:hypothetical protein